MNLFGRRHAKNEVNQTPAKELPYDKRESLHALCLFVTIISRNQSDFFVEAYQKAGASLSLDLYGYSMPPKEVVALLGSMETKKEILLTFCRKEDLPKLDEIATKRFGISKASKGIAFACPIDSVSGVAVYKFLADQNKEVRESQHGNENN
ncbi:MAG: hypothetical protein LKM30_03300 [Bacilli bacterium]|jgi:hypothetical protein|nr:hypothetical protein [Bacilli bacterium]